MEDNRLEELCGSVERVVFRNADNGWTVLELEAGEELHKVVGVLPAVAAGEQLRLKGKWVEHPSFGRQFRADRRKIRGRDPADPGRGTWPSRGDHGYHRRQGKSHR